MLGKQATEGFLARSHSGNIVPSSVVPGVVIPGLVVPCLVVPGSVGVFFENWIWNFLKVGSGSITLWKVGSGPVTKSFRSTTLLTLINDRPYLNFFGVCKSHKYLRNLCCLTILFKAYFHQKKFQEETWLKII
jgi:hypothetical protein